MNWIMRAPPHQEFLVKNRVGYVGQRRLRTVVGACFVGIERSEGGEAALGNSNVSPLHPGFVCFAWPEEKSDNSRSESTQRAGFDGVRA